MAYPEHFLLAFGGHQGDPNEQWVCGIRLALYEEGLIAAVDEDEYLNDVAAPALADWFDQPSSLIYQPAQLQWSKFNKIRPDGRYADQTTTHEMVWPTPIQGGASQNPHPLQVAMVLSWRTNAAARGIASHGRIFSPRPAVAVNTGGDISGPERVGAAESAAALLNTLDITVGSGWMRPSIVSPGVRWPQEDNPGLAHQIDRVVVDSSLDVQRRRSMSQSKEVSSAPVTY